jgi:hypothetical protein
MGVGVWGWGWVGPECGGGGGWGQSVGMGGVVKHVSGWGLDGSSNLLSPFPSYTGGHCRCDAILD